MDQVFRIEIPVEVINKSDTGAIKNLESALAGVYASANKTKKAASEAMQSMTSGAKEAASSLDKVEKAADKASDRFEQIDSAADEAADSVDEVAEATNTIDKNGKLRNAKGRFVEMGSAAKQAGASTQASMNAAGQATDRFTQRMEKSQRTLRGMFREKFQLIMSAIDRASPAIKSVWDLTKRLTGRAWHVAVRMKDFVTAPFRKIISLLSNPITMALSVAGIGMSARDVMQTFNQFETGMSAVRSLTGATGEDFIALKQTAKDLGATTSFSASEATQGMQYLAMAGWNTNQIMAAMPGLLDLAAAGATELGTAADIVSDVMTAMGMSADQASRAADIFAKTATSSNTTIEGLGETLKYAAPVAHSFGLQLHEVSALAGMMANAGIKGSMAGTALRSSLMNMAAPTKEAAKIMKDLNLNFSNADGSMKKMNTIVRELSGAFAGLTDKQRLEYTETLFGTYASSAWLGVISQGADVFDTFADSLDNSAGAAKEMALIRLDNLAGDMEELGGAMETAKLELMEKLDPYMRQAVQWLTTKIPAIKDKIIGLAQSAIDKFKEVKESFTSVFSSADFKNADGLAAKFFVLWDKIIAEPFNAWWQGPGQAKVLATVTRIAESMGKFLRGMITGIFAAIKGEDIDFEGLNITGFARAGAEGAKTFVSSFVSAFDIKKVVGSMPGVLKAGLFGLGAVKVGSGVLGLSKALSFLRLGFGGAASAAVAAEAATATVGTTAAASAVGVGKAGIAMGGLKAALAAIPVWGWVAAAAITAAGIGIKVYSDAQERNRQKLLHFSDGAKQAAQEYVESAQKVQQFNQAVDDIKLLEIKVKQGQNNQSTITQLEAQLAHLDSREVWLLAQLADGTLTPEQIAAYQAELDTLRGKRVELEAQLAENTMRAADVRAYMDELAVLKGREEAINMKLTQGVTPEQAQTYMDELAIIKSREETISLKLEGYGWVGHRLAYISSTIDRINTAKAEVVLLLSQSSLTAQQVKDYASALSDINTKRAELELQLTGASLEPDQVKALRDNLKDIDDRRATIEAKMAQGGLSEREVETLAKNYAELTERKAQITMQLSAQGLNQEQLGALVEKYQQIEDREAKIKAALSAAGMSQKDIENVAAAMKGIGDMSATINIAMAEGSLDQEQLEALNKQIADAKQGLIDLSGGIITADDFGADGLPDPGKMALAKQYRDAEAAARLAELQGQVEADRRTLEQAKQQRDAYRDAYETAQTQTGNIKTAQDVVTVLQAERDALVGQYGTQVLRAQNKEISWDEFAAWKSGTYLPGLRGLQSRYQSEVSPLLVASDGSYHAAKDAPGIDYLSEIGGFDQVLMALKQASERAGLQLGSTKGDYDTQQQSLITHYRNEKQLIEAQTFQGTDLAGRTLEDLAANYAQLNDAGRQMFDDAVNALAQLNQKTDYIREEDKTQAINVAEIAAKAEVMETVKTRVQTIATDYSVLSEEQQKAFAASAEGAEALKQVNSALEALGIDKIQNLNDINKAVEALKAVDLSAFTLTKVQEAFVGVGGDAAGAKTKVDDLIAALKAADGLKATTTLTQNTITNDAGGKIPRNAAGGIYDGAFLSLVAEDGPEAIIPLGSKRRSRGLELWRQAGEMLGVNAYGEGGILAPYTSAIADITGEDWDGGGGNKPASFNASNGGKSQTITVHVAANPTFQIQGGDGEDVMDAIKDNISELSEILGASFAQQLEKIVPNMV